MDHVIVPGGEYRLRDVPKNALVRRKDQFLSTVNSKFFISGAEFTRDVSGLIRGTQGSRTFMSPGSLKVVCDYAFELAGSLISAVLNEGLEEIREEAFSRSGLRKISLPATMVAMAHSAFSYCPNLKAV